MNQSRLNRLKSIEMDQMDGIGQKWTEYTELDWMDQSGLKGENYFVLAIELGRESFSGNNKNTEEKMDKV